MQFRKASVEDARQIQRMVREAQINPLQLDWRRFLLAIDEDGRITGCAQVKPHQDGTRELASLVVVEEQRGQGLARRLIEQLQAEHGAPLYLTCRSGLEPFYRRFGFSPLGQGELPPYFRRLAWLASGLMRLAGRQEHLSVMRWDGA